MLREWSKELIEDKDFEFGGQIFRIRYPYWEEMAEVLDYTLQPAEEESENGKAQVFSFKDDTQYAIEKIPRFLDEDGPKRFKALVANKTKPVPRHQIVQLYRWLVQTTGALPTTPPSGSEPGGGDEDTSSEEESS